MKSILKIIALYFLVSLFSCSDDKISYRNDLKSEIDSTGFDGCFVMYDISKNKKTYVNYERCLKRYSPASTFKIPHSLIALQTSAVSSVRDTIKFNGIPKSIESWNQDHDLESAFKNSVVWYFQDIANRIGNEKMKIWLDTLTNYGTMIKAGELDKFWLDGSLVISSNEQVDFLEKLFTYKLPFNKENIDIVKQFMLWETNPNYKIYAKTGLSDVDKTGWMVGWVEKANETYIFATNITYKDTLNNNFLSTRVLLTKKLLNKLRVI